MKLLRESKPKAGAKPEINVTPLVDVCLVLLIIFMVVMPQIAAGGRVEMPNVDNPDPKYENAMDPVTLTITFHKRFLVDNQDVDEAQAYDYLRKVHVANPNRRLRLMGDRNLDYALIRRVFARCQNLGYRGIALMVTSKKAEEGDT